MSARRLVDHPIITPESHESLGNNINGPSLVRVPEWVPNPLGRWYLYFAHHKGDHIRLAYADEVTGPWTVHPGGVLDLADSRFLTEPPPATDEEVGLIEQLYIEALGEYAPPNGLRDDITTPHIASPDVRVNRDFRMFSMYFHGLESLGVQATRHATSVDGLHFDVDPILVDGTYLRAFSHRASEYAIVMPGTLLRRTGGPTEFEVGPTILPKQARHTAVHVSGDTITIYWTRVGDAPERILASTIDASVPWTSWTVSDPVDVLVPERPWEGSDEPVSPSVRSVAPGPVNQLRDPAIAVVDGKLVLVYAVAGEHGLGIAELLS